MGLPLGGRLLAGAPDAAGAGQPEKPARPYDAAMSAEDLERYETEIELQLYHEYKSVLPLFKFVVETERRFYLANEVDMQPQNENGRPYFRITLKDAWVWDMYRPARFVANVTVVTFKDVNVEELPEKEL